MLIYGLYICITNNYDGLKIQGHFLNLDILITVLNILLEIYNNTIQEIYIVTIKNNKKN